MNARRVKIVVWTIAVILAMAAPTVYASSSSDDQGCKEGSIGAGEAEGRREALCRDLDLSEAQKKQLEENKNKGREEMKALHGAMKEKKAAIRRELQGDVLDMDKITVLNSELKKLEAQMTDYRLERVLAVRKILTPEQFKKFMKKMEKKAEHFKGKRD